eukprot:COSAG01_NODE_13572_length_1566_cov_1.222222_2_plen_125_part_00
MKKAAPPRGHHLATEGVPSATYLRYCAASSQLPSPSLASSPPRAFHSASPSWKAADSDSSVLGGASCSQNGYLLSRGGCQTRWHSLVNFDHGDSTTSHVDSPRRRPQGVRAPARDGGIVIEGRA